MKRSALFSVERFMFSAKCLLACLFTLPPMMTVEAQNVSDAFYIYRNDGQFNAFFRDEVDSIAYSYYDADSVYYNDIVTQIIYTPDSIYRIPLAAIDSVGFVQPETKYQSSVMRMTEEWLPYVLAIGDNSITFRSVTPSKYLPELGQVLVTETFEEPFTLGFSGRVIKQDTYPDSLVFTVEEISLSDIYEHIVQVGVSSSYDEEEPQNSKPKRIWGMNTDKGVKFPLPNVDVELGPVALSCRPSVVMKYIVCVGEPNLKDYVDVRVHHVYNGSVSMEVKREADYHPEPNWIVNVPINTSIPGLYGRIRLGGFVRASGKVSISATQPFVIEGVSGFVKSEGQPSRRINVWNATFEDTEAEISLDGTFSTGLAAQLQFGIIHEKIASADITAYVGPQLSAHFSLSAEGVVDKTLYSSLKNSEVTLAFGAEIVPGYRFWGSTEHHEAPVSLNLGYDINHWYVVPTFSSLAYEPHGLSGQLKGDIERNLLPKVRLGWVLYDKDDNIYKKEYFGQPYRKKEDWTTKGLALQLTDLPSGARFKAYPLVSLLGIEMRADQSVDIRTDFPVTIDNFKQTKSQYKKGGFTHEGEDYDYRYDVAVTVSIEDLEGVADWGYVYRDPNGKDKEISLRSHGTSYTDNSYAYFRNTSPATVTLFGYVKYVGSDKPVYGEPEDFEVIHAYTDCPDSNHPHWIDLGLPSGTQWRCCNEGASTPEAYGGYYTFGQVASAPTRDQIIELVDYCSHQWTGPDGVKFTGPNGGTIFLPAAGFRWDGELYYPGGGYYGYYWSSTPYDEDSAYYLSFLSDYDTRDGIWCDWERWYGVRDNELSVRPVR